MTVLQFAPFSSLVQPAFWHELTSLKIDVLRLSDDSVPVNASYALGKSIKDRETGKEIALGCNLTVGGGSLSKDSFQYAAHSPQRFGADGNHIAIDCLPILSAFLEYSRILTPSRISRRLIRQHSSTSWLTRYRYLVAQQPVLGIFTLSMQDLGHRHY